MQQRLAEISEFSPPLSKVSARVLIVESDESARSVLAVALRASGMDVLEADTGAMALKLARDNDIELAIVSSDLNGEDGISVVAQMRGEERDRSMPVVLLAKGGEEGLSQLSKVVDAGEVLLKPAFAKEVAAVAVMQLSERTLDGTVKLDASQAPPNQLLRALLNGDRSGVFELCGGRAHIAFRKGQVIDAQVDRHHGPDALVKALALHIGPYRVAFRPVQFAPAFQLGAREVLHRIEPRLRAFSDLAATSVSLDSVLGIEFAALAKALPSLPDAANAIVRLFDGLRTVRQVVLDSAQDELLTLQVTQRLLALSVITVDEGLHPPHGKAPQMFGTRKDDADQQMSELFSGAPLQVAVETGAESTDWADVLIRGEPEGDPSAGWVAGKLEPELAKQLEAFDIKAVEEPAKAPLPEELSPALLELKAFAAPIPLTETVTPLVAQPEPKTPIEAASFDALEDGFFDAQSGATRIPDPNVTPPSARAGTGGISSAALKAVSNTDQMGAVTSSATVEPKRGGMGLMIAALLLVVTVAIVASIYGRSEAPAPPPAPVVAVVPPPQPPVEPEPVAVVRVEKPETAESLKVATDLYESGKLKEAIESLEQIIVDDPGSDAAWMMLGLARYDSGNASAATEAANTVLQLDPKNARAHLLLATMLIDQWKHAANAEDKAKARKAADDEIQKYLDNDPNGKFADEARALLKR